MLDWVNRIQTDVGVFSLKDIATKFSGYTVKDFHNRYFSSEIKTDRRFIAQAKQYQIKPLEDFKVINEYGCWASIDYIYFFGSTDVIFESRFHVPNLPKITNQKTCKFGIKATLAQNFLVSGDSKLVWKKIQDFNGIRH